MIQLADSNPISVPKMVIVEVKAVSEMLLGIILESENLSFLLAKTLP